MSLTISSLTVSPTTVIGGAGQVTLTITMSAPAPTGGLRAVLSQPTTPQLLNLPPYIYVAGGQTVGTAQFTTFPINWQWISPNGVLTGVTATYYDSTGNPQTASCTFTVQSYGQTSGPGFPPSPGFTTVPGWSSQPSVLVDPYAIAPKVGSQSTASTPAPNSNLVLGQSGTQQAMAMLNILNIGTTVPAKDGR
jgi:hypothetical protein